MVMLVPMEAGPWSGLSAQSVTGVHFAFKAVSPVIGVRKSMILSCSDHLSNL